jgi:ribonuclease D
MPPLTPVRYRFLTQAADIRACITSWTALRAIALDLEADSLYSYPEKVCLVQVSTADENVILDPLRGAEGMRTLSPLLADRGILKVLHGGDYDVRLLKRGFGFELHNLADTMIGAQLLGRQRVGLADLLKEEMGAQIDKRYQHANWSRRPLPEEMLLYAALDTAYLLPLWQRLSEQLSHLGRLNWAREEFELLEQATPAAERPPSCFDVKGAYHLPARQRATLQALVELREETARAWGRPPFKVLGNQVLLNWAQNPPLDHRELLQSRGASKGILHRLAPQILTALRAAQSVPVSDCPQRHLPSRPPLSQEEHRRLRRLKQVRQAAAERLDLSAGLLVNTRTLETLARAAPDEAAAMLQSLLKRWQITLLGPALLQALQA